MEPIFLEQENFHLQSLFCLKMAVLVSKKRADGWMSSKHTTESLSQVATKWKRRVRGPLKEKNKQMSHVQNPV